MNDTALPDRCRDRDENRLFRALSHHRRRAVLRVLNRSRAVTLSELATEVARLDTDGTTDDRPSRDIGAIRSHLHHRHVPLLVDVGLVEYAPERDAVSVSDEADVEACLTLLETGQ